MDGFLFTVLLIVFVVVVLVIMAARSERVREWLKPKEGKSDRSILHVFSIYELVFGGGGAVAILRFVYRAWRRAPEGSPAKLGWSLIMAAVFAVGLWLILAWIDRRINGPEMVPAGSNEVRESEIDVH